MIESKLHVEWTSKSNIDNPFYGKRKFKSVLEETTEFEKHENVDTPPAGVHLVGNIDKYTKIDLTADKLWFEAQDGECWSRSFGIGEKVYELSVWFTEDGKVRDVLLELWLNVNDFLDGSNADEKYRTKTFELVEVVP